MDEPEQQQDQRSETELSERDIERLRKMIGGKRDIADGAIPALIFVIANSIWSLNVAVIASGAYGIAITLYRLARKQDAKRALFGLLGLGIAAGIALYTGSASAYFVPGVAIGGLLGLVTLLTVAIKQPTSATFAMALERKPPEHYKEPEVLRTHMIITTVWSFVYLAKAGFRAYLIADGQTELLGITALALGYPLTLGLAAGSVYYLRRRTGHINAIAPDVSSGDTT